MHVSRPAELLQGADSQQAAASHLAVRLTASFAHIPSRSNACFQLLTCAYFAALYCSTMRTETGEVIDSSEVTAGSSTGDVEGGNLRNNYSRPEGQNVGNFLSDRPSSRVLAAPGGASSIVFGSDEPAAPAPRSGRAPGSLAPASDQHMSSNNYARPDGQNCGNFLTDRKVGVLCCIQWCKH